MPNIKIIGACSIFAFVISLFSGIIGGVGFLTILFRAFLGAVIFGLLGGALLMLLERMIPELFETAGTEDAEDVETEQGESGSNVDITLDEEAESYSPTPDASGGMEAGGLETGGMGSASPETASAETEAEGDRQQNDFREEDDQFVEEVAENTAGEESGDSFLPHEGGEHEPGGAEGFEEVDTLPDLEDFADSFEGVAASQEEGSEGNFSSNSTAGSSGGLSNLGGGASSSSVEVNGDQHDPATVAKAVRTLMKKDQEG